MKRNDKNRKKLRREYTQLAPDDRLKWCTSKANQMKPRMSYGEFVTWLGI